jgi:hypothetical protein
MHSKACDDGSPVFSHDSNSRSVLLRSSSSVRDQTTDLRAAMRPDNGGRTLATFDKLVSSTAGASNSLITLSSPQSSSNTCEPSFSDPDQPGRWLLSVRSCGEEGVTRRDAEPKCASRAFAGQRIKGYASEPRAAHRPEDDACRLLWFAYDYYTAPDAASRCQNPRGIYRRLAAERTESFFRISGSACGAWSWTAMCRKLVQGAVGTSSICVAALPSASDNRSGSPLIPSGTTLHDSST